MPQFPIQSKHTETHTLTQEDGLRRVKPFAESVYRSSRGDSSSAEAWNNDEEADERPVNEEDKMERRISLLQGALR